MVALPFHRTRACGSLTARVGQTTTRPIGKCSGRCADCRLTTPGGDTVQIGIQRTALSVALGMAVLALATAPACADPADPDQPAQGTAPSDAQSNTQAQGGSGTEDPTKLEGVVVTGYRRSIQQ